LKSATKEALSAARGRSYMGFVRGKVWQQGWQLQGLCVGRPTGARLALTCP